MRHWKNRNYDPGCRRRSRKVCRQVVILSQGLESKSGGKPSLEKDHLAENILDCTGMLAAGTKGTTSSETCWVDFSGRNKCGGRWEPPQETGSQVLALQRGRHKWRHRGNKAWGLRWGWKHRLGQEKGCGKLTWRIPSSNFGAACSIQLWAARNIVVQKKNLEVSGSEYTECAPKSGQGSWETQKGERHPPPHCKCFNSASRWVCF